MDGAATKKLTLTSVACCICDLENAEPIGSGRDYEYDTSEDVFTAVRCRSCDLIYLNPRPEMYEFETIYPSNYHAFDFSEQDYGLVYKIRSRLEANRILGWCHGLPADAKIVDIGCGDGFHLKLLGRFGEKTWSLEGIDFDKRAVRKAEAAGLKVYSGTVEDLDFEENQYDLALMIQTIEHVEHPHKVLTAAYNILKPGGKLVIVTDNTDSIDCKLFSGSYWGGYHFPRHWNLFNRKSLKLLAERTEFLVANLTTQVSPVNWVYSVHNALVDLNAPRFLINRWTLKSFVSLSAFTSLDIFLQKLGRGGLLCATLQKEMLADGLST